MKKLRIIYVLFALLAVSCGRDELIENEVHNQLGSSLVSFKLDSIAEQLATAKGIKLRVNTIYDNIQYATIDINEDKNLKIKSFHSQ